MKEQLSYLCRGVPDGAVLQRRLQRLATLELFLEAAEEAFSALPAELLDLGAWKSAQLAVAASNH